MSSNKKLLPAKESYAKTTYVLPSAVVTYIQVDATEVANELNLRLTMAKGSRATKKAYNVAIEATRF